MREIEFRAKRIDNGEWCYFSLSDAVNNAADDVNQIFNFIQCDINTVCQYTGLTDKNGRKIFEGDIFKFNDEVWSRSYTSCGMEYDSYEVENYGVVGYYSETARYDFCRYKYNENSVEADLHENHCIEFAYFIQELEVIGNIFDNSELLEVRNE